MLHIQSSFEKQDTSSGFICKVFILPHVFVWKQLRFRVDVEKNWRVSILTRARVFPRWKIYSQKNNSARTDVCQEKLKTRKKNECYIVDHASAPCSFTQFSRRLLGSYGRKSSRRNRGCTYDHGWSCAIRTLSPDRSTRYSCRSVTSCLGIVDTARFMTLIYGADLGRLFPFGSLSLSLFSSPE